MNRQIEKEGYLVVPETHTSFDKCMFLNVQCLMFGSPFEWRLLWQLVTRKKILLEFSHPPDTSTIIFVIQFKLVQREESKAKITARIKTLNRHKLLSHLIPTAATGAAARCPGDGSCSGPGSVCCAAAGGCSQPECCCSAAALCIQQLLTSPLWFKGIHSLLGTLLRAPSLSEYLFACFSVFCSVVVINEIKGEPHSLPLPTHINLNANPHRKIKINYTFCSRLRGKLKCTGLAFLFPFYFFFLKKQCSKTIQIYI